MAGKNNNIIIQDWTGKILFKGSYKDKQVDKVLDANRCYVCGLQGGNENCSKCGDTGYECDFEVMWEDEENAPYENVYECINY